MKVYFDNETVPSLEKTIETSILSDSEEAVYGEYVFSLGAVDMVEDKVVRGEKMKAGMRFNTIAIEIYQESSEKFKIYDIIASYKQGTRISKTMSLQNNLF